jgi:tetratricopeptide (TPR) repeat protein
LDSATELIQIIKCYDKAIELNPDCGVYWYNKSITLKAVGKSKDSKKCYEKAKELEYKG